MAIMTHAKFHFNRFMLTLIFGIRASESPGQGERLKRTSLIGLRMSKTGAPLWYVRLNLEPKPCLRTVLFGHKSQTATSIGRKCKLVCS